MNSAKPMTKRDKVCLYLYENGPQTIDQICKQFPWASHRFVWNMVVAGGPLDRVDKHYDLTPQKRKYFDMCEIQPTVEYRGEVATPADPALNSKPWTSKYSIANAPRREEIRKDVSFINGSIGFSTGYRI